MQPAATLNPCRAAIERYWPKNLWNQAFETLDHENGLELPTRKGPINVGGSQDFGCMQINNYAHPDFFKNHDWSDPNQNAQEAYFIYLGREAAQGNGWRAWYSVEGLLW